MEIGKNWRISLIGGILGLFSLALPWFGIQVPSKASVAAIVGVSPLELLRLDWLTSGDAFLARLPVVFALLLLASIVAFIAGCFLAMAGRKGSLLMIVSNLAVFMLILVGLVLHLTRVITPHYGGLVGFVAGFVCFVGLPVRDGLKRLTDAQWKIVDTVVGIPWLSRVEIAQMLDRSVPEVLDDVELLEKEGLIVVERFGEGSRVYASPGMSARLRRELRSGEANAVQFGDQ